MTKQSENKEFDMISTIDFAKAMITGFLSAEVAKSPKGKLAFNGLTLNALDDLTDFVYALPFDDDVMADLQSLTLKDLKNLALAPILDQSVKLTRKNTTSADYIREAQRLGLERNSLENEHREFEYFEYKGAFLNYAHCDEQVFLDWLRNSDTVSGSMTEDVAATFMEEKGLTETVY